MGGYRVQTNRSEMQKPHRRTDRAAASGVPNSALLSVWESGGAEPSDPGGSGGLGARILARQPGVQPRPLPPLPGRNKAKPLPPLPNRSGAKPLPPLPSQSGAKPLPPLPNQSVAKPLPPLPNRSGA